MLSYPLDEAETLLASKLAAATQSHSNCEEDLEFLREQITVGNFSAVRVRLYRGLTSIQTMEVAIARVYNWDISKKRKEKLEQDTGLKESPNG